MDDTTKKEKRTRRTKTDKSPKPKKDDISVKDCIRKNLYIRRDQNKALKKFAADVEKDEYRVIIDALDNYIPKNYFK